ncbi:S49 family peptidase [Bacteroides sp. An19]|uniref:S49 family peptidase n=1 Tax=Bacteroides sp. An19 TaxID=1965580 RepID=UPI0031B83E56
MLEHEGRLMKRGDSFADAPEGSTAVIPLRGTMLKYGTMCSYGTTEIASVIREAAASKNISSIVLDIDSGGGSVDAIAPLADAIRQAQSARKAVVASCSLCASAAYYVASYCNEILADNDIDAEFGSIGVMMSFADYAKYYENEGIKVHTIYSNLSDYKNAPFEAAKKGEYAKIRDEELDPLARDFQENVKRNRGARLKADTEGVLRGRMFYARDAVRTGLADAVGTLAQAAERSRELSAQMCIDDYMGANY